MMQMDMQTFFLFLIPGFISLKVYYMLINYKNDNQFEYFMLSCFWGLVLLVFYGSISRKEAFVLMLGNVYASAIILSGVGAMCAVGLSCIARLSLKNKRE